MMNMMGGVQRYDCYEGMDWMDNLVDGWID